MLSMLLVVFIVQLAIHLLSVAGSDAINQMLWNLYNKTPIAQTGQSAKINALRKEVIALNKEMSNTSAQDDFAKWAKLRRQHDKKKDEYDKHSQEVKDVQAKFNQAAGVARWISTTGTRYALQWYFGKQAMFYLPKGWVPYAAEWILSFPSAPLGSISINMWWIACASVISMVAEATSATRSISSRGLKTKEMPVPSPGPPSQKSSSTEKQEL